jgi:hypothetical protein
MNVFIIYIKFILWRNKLERPARIFAVLNVGLDFAGLHLNQGRVNSEL